MPGEFGALLEEALGREPARVAAPHALEALDGSLILAANARATAVADRDATADAGSLEEFEPIDDVRQADELRPPDDRALFPGAATTGPVSEIARRAAPPETVETAEALSSPDMATAEALSFPDVGTAEVLPSADIEEARTAAPVVSHQARAGVPRPATVDGRVELDPDWMDWPLLRQPVVLKPGASVGTPGGGSYIANPGTIPITFVPGGTGADPSAGTYFVDPAEVAAAVGPLGALTEQLMAQLSGHPYRVGPPTAIQMAIIEAARRAGLRFGPEP